MHFPLWQNTHKDNCVDRSCGSSAGQRYVEWSHTTHPATVKVPISFSSVTFQEYSTHHNVVLAVKEVGRVSAQTSGVSDPAKIPQRQMKYPGKRSVGTISSWALNRSEVHSHTPPFDPLPPSFSPPIVALRITVVSRTLLDVGTTRPTGLGASS